MMLKSGLAQVSWPIAKVAEYLLCRQIASGEPIQPIFIIGAPRTGSTILYQAITNAGLSSYIDNTVCLWHRNLLFGFWLSNFKYGGRPHSNFNAEFGETSQFGGRAPSECGKFWYRWLPRDRHYADENALSDGQVEELRRIVGEVTAFTGLPLLFKNLNAGQRLKLMHRIFPDAKYIFVRRDPRFVVRSIMAARRTLGIGAGEWWSVKPKNFSDLCRLEEIDMCAAQVFFLEKQIEDDLRGLSDNRVRQVNFQDFDRNMVVDLLQWAGIELRPGIGWPEFKRDSPSKIESNELEILEQAVSKQPFDSALFIF